MHPNQCGSLPGLSTYDACLTLTNDVKTLQRPRLKVSSLFLDIKAGFDNVDNPTLAQILREGGIPPYLVSWVSSFLREQSCTLIFQGAPGTPAPVNVGAPQGSPISPLLFLLYVAPLHSRIPQGLMISYVDDFALTVASLSYRGNIRRLQELFEKLEKKASRLGVSFSVAKKELIHWRTPSQSNSPKCVSPIQVKGEIFYPSNSVRWLEYWFTPALDTAAHFSRRLAIAQGAFALIRRLSPPGVGLPPYLCHRLASSLIAPILLYGSDLFTPGLGTTNHLDTFWRKVQRWTTNCFSATPTLPPQSRMDNTYSALNKRVREKLLTEWASLFPTPGYYLHPAALCPRPFMGLGKFIAGRIHQMRARKSYLAAHPTWWSPDADTSCPRSGLEPETFEHAILSCPSRQHSRSRVLHGVTDVGPEAPLWSSLPLLKRLATFIGVTSTGFPHTMFLPTTPPRFPPVPSLPPQSTPPNVSCFFVG